jgi:hypothetical protein
LLALETEFTGNKSSSRSTSDDTAGKLVLLPSAPCKNFTLVVESKNVVDASSKRNNVLQLRDNDRGALSSNARLETQNAIVALFTSEM